MDQGEPIGAITAPTLIIAGQGTIRRPPWRPPSSSASRIKGSKLAVLDAAHISNIEQPQAYTTPFSGTLRG